MFRNRKLTLTVDKKDKDHSEIHQDPKTFEKKADIVLHRLESIGAKMFLGVCVYVLLDTYRQVAVAHALTTE